MNKIVYIIFLTILFGFSLPKPICTPVDTYHNWDEHTKEKEILKSLKKAKRIKNGPQNYYQIADILFSKAFLSYINTGSIDTSTFHEAQAYFKKSYSRECGRIMSKKGQALYKIGLSYYYTGEYNEADKWLLKCSKISGFTFATLNYSKCLLKENDLDSFNIVINNYCTLYQLNIDSTKNEILWDIKNGH